jgi:hypothetical protein
VGFAPPPTKQHQGKYRGSYSRVNHNEHLFLIQRKVPKLPSGQQIETDKEGCHPVEDFCDSIVEFFL